MYRVFYCSLSSCSKCKLWTPDFLVFATQFSLEGQSSMPDQDTAEAAVSGFDQRVDAVFRAESGKPLVRARKEKPLGPGRGNYVRAYSYYMVGFAARCLYLSEMLDEANAALAENAQHYLDNPLDINDRDSFHWHAEIVTRLAECAAERTSPVLPLRVKM